MKDEKPKYEPPKAMRLNSLDAARGADCDPAGSIATDDCKDGVNATDNCGMAG